MKTCKKPKLTMIYKDKNVWETFPNELCYFDVDEKAREVVVKCCFEKIEPWEYLAGIGTPVISKYIEELEEKECFRRLKEPVEICRIECDVDEGDSVLDLNNSDPWQFPVRNEPRWDPVLEEISDEELEEYNACDRDAIFPKHFAIRKDGRWWIVELECLYICETSFIKLEPLNDLREEGLLVGESDDGYQYGLFLNGFDNKYTNLQGDDWDEGTELEEAWSRISRVAGNLVLLERYSDGEVVHRKLMDEFETVIAEDTWEDLRNDDGFTVEGDPVAWVECRGKMTLVDVKDSAFSTFMEPLIEILGTYEVVDRFEDCRILAQDGDRRNSVRIAVNCTFVPGIWEDARIIGASWDLSETLFCVKRDGLWGIIDRYGEVLVPIRFMKISELGFDGDDVLVELDSFDTVRRGRLHPEPCPEKESFWGLDGWPTTMWDDKREYVWEFELDPME